MNRVLLKALYEMQLQQLWAVTAASPYATTANEKYFPDKQLIGFGGSRWRFMLAMVFRALRPDMLFVAHINLAPAARLYNSRFTNILQEV